MGRRAMAFVAGTLLLLGLGAGSALATPTGELSFELVDAVELSDRLRELTFRSPAADGGTATVRILLPDGYDASGATRYPVLYLLHGGGGVGGHDDWTLLGDAEAATAGLPLIVVMPGVTGHGNYVDWYNHGRGGAPMWETFVVGQLLPWVDATFPTVAERQGRAVAGASMGGGGAMGYAAHHPDLFVSAAAFSGAVDTNTSVVQLVAGTTGFEHGHEPGAVFGHRLTDEVRWRTNNPWDLAGNLRGVDLFLTVGNGLPGPGGDTSVDVVEQQCLEMMTNLHDRLAELGIEHHWDGYGPGAHGWWYWTRSLRQYLPHVLEVFAEHRPAPEVVTLTDARSTFGAFGWSVAMTRPSMEFATLSTAGPDGFTLHGTGAATVTTPSRYSPGSAWSVAVAGAGRSATTTVVADGAGRLTVPVDLGPGNPLQQFTLEGRAWALTQPEGRWPVRTATVTFAPVPPAAIDEPAPAGPVGGPTLPATGGGAFGVGAVGLLAAALLLRRVVDTST